MTTGSTYHGKLITEVLPPSGKSLKCKVRTPPTSKLFNFDFKVGGDTYLILDGYGDEHLPEEVIDRIFGRGSFEHGYALAISRSTGATFTAHFGTDGRVHFMSLHDLSIKVPKRFLKRLDELMSKKRPFSLGLTEDAWRDLWDREIGFRDLEEDLVVNLSFDRKQLQVWGAAYREVAYWSRG